jgi:hypothetical protein
MASAVAAVLLGLMAWVILARAGLVETARLPTSWLEPLAWIVAGYFAVGTVANLVSRSRMERIWGPVSLVIAVCAGIVAAS